MVAMLVGLDQWLKASVGSCSAIAHNACLFGGGQCFESKAALIGVGWLTLLPYAAISVALSSVFRRRADVALPLMLYAAQAVTLALDTLGRGYAVDYLALSVGGWAVSQHLIDLAGWAAAGLVIYYAIDGVISKSQPENRGQTA